MIAADATCALALPPRQPTRTSLWMRRSGRPRRTSPTREGDLAVNLTSQDIRTKVRKRKVGASIVFCVDASGSMGAESRIDAAKAAIMELLVDAYQRRDRVGMVSFRGDRADIILAPTASVELAQIKMRSLPTGGATPLAAGLERALEVVASEKARNPDIVQWLVLVTDGRANVGLNGGLGSEDARVMASRLRAEDINTVVIDTGSSTSTGRSRACAGGRCRVHPPSHPHRGGHSSHRSRPRPRLASQRSLGAIALRGRWLVLLVTVQGGWSGPVSRILSWTAIYLGSQSPATSRG